MGNYVQPEPQKSNTTRNIVIAIVAVCVLICCCLVLVIGALTLLGPAVGKVYSSINASLESPTMPGGFPTMSPKDFPTISPDMTIPALSDVIPTGGKGDETQRASAWGYVIIQASFDGCVMSNPKASDTKISVTQEPDSDGVWVEEWTVNCDGGTSKTYSVTFTPSTNGTTDIKVK